MSGTESSSSAVLSTVVNSDRSSMSRKLNQVFSPVQHRHTVKLEQDNGDRICRLAVDHGLDTSYIADRSDISRRRVQQLAKEYRDTGDLPRVETPGRNPFAEYPADIIDRVLDLYKLHEQAAAAIAHIVRQCDDLTIDNNRVHTILQEYEHVTETPNKQGRKRPWVPFERDYSLITVHLDWYQNGRDDWVLAVEDDASRKSLGMIEEDGRFGAATVQLLDTVREKTATDGEILEVITDHGSEFYATKRDDRGEADHAFENYLAEHDIKQTLCKVGRPQSNGKIERFYQTYEKHRWRFDSLDTFVEYYNEQRPHRSLKYDDQETPAETFDRLLPTADDAAQVAVADGGGDATK
jgi:transposase InsO family protein